MANDPDSIPGYHDGKGQISRSPVSLDDLRQLEESADFTEVDRCSLRMAGEVLSDQAEDMVNAWLTRIGAQPHLAKWFQGPDGQPDECYKSAVKPRFVQWVIDACTRPYDRAWLDYQEEIGLRHTPAKKNATDHVETPPLVPLRFLVGFMAVIVTTAKDLLAKKGHAPAEIERMHAAWTKAVLLTLALWSRPYSKDDLW